MDDPLRNLPQQEEMLFREFTRIGDGKALDAVMGACINMIVNCIRQSFGKRADAEAKFDELFGKGKQILLHNHYDSVTGVRRNVFPHTQIVAMHHHVEDLGPAKRGNGQ
jgi:hypothetical protein